MYICISTLGDIKPGEVLVLEKETQFGEISAKQIGGGIVGFVMHSQPDGCAEFGGALRHIGGRKVIAQAVLTFDDAAVLHSESTFMLPPNRHGTAAEKTITA